MRARSLPHSTTPNPLLAAVPRPSVAALHFLRGRDADGRLRELAAVRAAARPVLGALAGQLVGRRLFESLGYRSLGDFTREHLGLGARTVREWARVWHGLEELPALRAAVLAGEVSWSVARCVVGLATPETERACLETVRGRTLRAVQAIVAAVREAGATRACEEAAGGDEADDEGEERTLVRLPCTAREALLWHAAVELARRMAGEQWPTWKCAEAIAAEAAGALEPAESESSSVVAEADLPRASGRGSAAHAAQSEHGVRQTAFPGLSWQVRPPTLPTALAGLAEHLDEPSAREVDLRLQAVVGFLQRIDLETGRILRQVAERRLYRELGFESFERYAAERLDLSPRTARRLVALARAEHRAPSVAKAFRAGEITALQALTLAEMVERPTRPLPAPATPAPAPAPDTSASAWLEHARRVTLRRLEDDVAAVHATCGQPAVIAFRAPPSVAALFLDVLARAGSLEALLAHAIATWREAGAAFSDYADFERDEFRCTVPGCTARRNLHSHHIRFRSANGADAPSNRTTLCACHHLRGVHLGRLRIRGRAPDRLLYELGVETPERFCSGDVRLHAPAMARGS